MMKDNTSKQTSASRKNSFSAKRLTALALLTAIALAIYVAESALPTLIPIPGIKLGLANIITLIVLRRMKLSDAALVLLMRIILGSVIAGQMVSFLYSICGGVLCLLVMAAVNKLLQGHGIFITSIFGAIAHNIGQIFAALVILQMSGILAYIPFLMVSGVITGLFTGLCAYFADRYLPRRLFPL